MGGRIKLLGAPMSLTFKEGSLKYSLRARSNWRLEPPGNQMSLGRG